MVYRGDSIADPDRLYASNPKDPVCPELAWRAAPDQHRHCDDRSRGATILAYWFCDWLGTATANLFLLVGRYFVGLLFSGSGSEEVVLVEV